MNIKDLIEAVKFQASVKPQDEFMREVAEGLEQLYEENNRQQAEIERLNDNLINKCIYLSDDETTEYCVNGPCPKFKTEKQIKSEVVKKFAEKVKKLSHNLYPFSDEPIIYCEDVDNLVKEMVGDAE